MVTLIQVRTYGSSIFWFFDDGVCRLFMCRSNSPPMVVSCCHSVCELDLVFSLHKSLLILFEMFIGGMLCESSKREVLKSIVEAEELVEEMTKPGEDTASQLDDGLSFQEQFQLGRTPGRRTGVSGPPGRR